jgi:hypothetical protein
MAVRAGFVALKWIIAAVLMTGLLAGAYRINDWVQGNRALEAADDKVDSASRAKNRIVKLGQELAESHGLKDEPATAVAWYPRVTAYGRVVPNPQATAEVRSPFAGTLRSTPDQPWPTLGGWLRSGQVLGRIDIRAGPTERLDIQAKLAEAEAKLAAAEKVLRIEEERLQRFGKISGEKVIAPYELDNARKLEAEARGQVMTAKAAVNLWKEAWDILQRRSEQSLSHWTEPLTAPAEGEVIDLVGRPGMSIESGGLIARVVDTRRPLVRLELPPEVLASGPAPSHVDLFAIRATARQLGSTDTVDTPVPAVPATLIGPAGEVDPASQFAGYWYEVGFGKKLDVNGNGSAGMAWRPGLFVQAHLKTTEAKPQEAVSIPLAALLFHSGRTLVYVRVGPGRFERREVRVLGREGDRWILAAGVAAEEPVVSRHAQVLLSEEFKPLGDLDND